jgi:hypothetical protein
MGRTLERAVIGRLAHRNRRARQIKIDIDGSVVPSHGHQPFAFFHGF